MAGIVLLRMSFVLLFSSSFCLEQSEVNEIVFSRLSTIELVISKIQQENEDLRAANNRLHMENNDLRRELAITKNELQNEVNSLQNNDLIIRRQLSTTQHQLKAEAAEFNHISRQTKRQLENIQERLKSAGLDNGILASASKTKTDKNEGYKKENQHSKAVTNDKSNSTAPKTKAKLQVTGITGITNSRFRQRLTDVSNKSKRLLVHGTAPQPSLDSKIAFSVHLQNHTTGLGNNQPIVFDQVNINEGAVYDTASGMFECNVPGTYFFTASILSHYHEEIQAEIVYNGKLKARIYASGSTGSIGYDQGSNSVILSCKNGDHVWIRHFSGHGTQIYGETYSHFAGFLLWTE